MLINEIFDNSYELDSGTSSALNFRNQLSANHPELRSLRIFEVKNDDSQFIMTFYSSDDAYEVHHFKIQNGIIYSGQILNSARNRNFAANPRYISTAIQLYKKELSRGHKIRVVADKASGMWPIYQRVIERLIDDKNYEVDKIDTNYVGMDGKAYIAQVIKPAGKFTESFKNIHL
jgi:hypothetical protein